MLRLIDPGEQLGCPIPADLDLERLFSLAAADICETHNALLDPEKRSAALPASQRWALDILRSPDAPSGREFDEADEALSVGRNNLVRRQLSVLRRQNEAGGMSVSDCARGIIDIVAQFGLRPVEQPKAPDPNHRRRSWRRLLPGSPTRLTFHRQAAKSRHAVSITPRSH